MQTPKYKDLSGVYYVAVDDEILFAYEFMDCVYSIYYKNNKNKVQMWVLREENFKKDLRNKKYGIKRIGEL